MLKEEQARKGKKSKKGKKVAKAKTQGGCKKVAKAKMEAKKKLLLKTAVYEFEARSDKFQCRTRPPKRYRAFSFKTDAHPNGVYATRDEAEKEAKKWCANLNKLVGKEF